LKRFEREGRAREYAEVGKKTNKVEADVKVNMNMKKIVEAEDEE